MWDLMDDANGIYKPSTFTPNNTINLNDDSNAIEKMQNFTIEENTNANEARMFEPPLVACFPPRTKARRSLIELMQDISGGFMDPIQLNATVTTLPTRFNAITLIPHL
jgi:hypothetical protein